MDWSKLFSYDPATGDLRWLVKNKRLYGKVAGSLHANSAGTGNRLRITMAKGSVYAHRIVWEMHHGPIPVGMFIDHIDCDGTNNKLSNLRLATHAENCRNRRLRKDNKSGEKGVCWDGFSWLAQINIEGTPTKIGRYATKEEAALAYNEAALRHHRQFARIR